VAIVLLAVFKNNLPRTSPLGHLRHIAMAATIQLYAKKRRQDKEKLIAEVQD